MGPRLAPESVEARGPWFLQQCHPSVRHKKRAVPGGYVLRDGWQTSIEVRFPIRPPCVMLPIFYGKMLPYQAPLRYAPLDSDAINAAAQTSIHLLGGFFSVCRDRAALRRNPIRSLASRDPICRKSRKIDGFYQISQRPDTIEPNGEEQT